MFWIGFAMFLAGFIVGFVTAAYGATLPKKVKESETKK